jgi:hypothetical protein
MKPPHNSPSASVQKIEVTMPVIPEVKPEQDNTIELLEMKTKRHKSEIKRPTIKPQLVEYDSFK